MSTAEIPPDGLTSDIRRQLALAAEVAIGRLNAALAAQAIQPAPLSAVDYTEWERAVGIHALLPMALLWEDLTPAQRQNAGMTFAFALLREVLKMGLPGVRLARELAALAKSS